MPDVLARDRCANCGEELRGEFCSRCGQRERDLHQPIGALLSQLVENVFSVDTRLVRTIRPLLLRPGEITREYLAGRRASYVPPVKAYLLAAFVLFGLFTIFPIQPRFSVFYRGSPEETAAFETGGSQLTVSLPRESTLGGEHYRRAADRAIANPQLFASAIYGGIPRAFFVILPLFALLLELFYRKQGYYVDHLVFSLYFHTFVFVTFSLFFIVSRTDRWLPGAVTIPLRLALVVWAFAYLAIALRRVYGGSRLATALKFTGLCLLYLPALFFSFLGVTVLALARF